MTDIAQLGIAVDTSQTTLAARELDKLVQAGGRAEGATKSLGNTSRQALGEMAGASSKAAQAMERMAASQERQERLTQQMARQMQELTGALQGNATANNAAAQAAQNAAQALGQQAAASKSAQAAAQSQATATTSAAAATGQMSEQATAASAAMGGLHSRIIASVGAVVSLNKVVQEMDAWTNMNNRIKLVTETQGQFAQAQSNILNIANSTRQPLKETAELYQRLAGAQKVLGLSGSELSGVVKTISQSMVISGTSAQSGAAALMQLGQAFNSGVLRGEEFNSVMEQAPGLMKAIAEGMGRTVGEMRGLAEAGKITTEEVVKALQKQAGSVEENFGKMGATVGQALTVSANKFTEFVGRADEATGVSKALSGAILNLSDNMGPLVTMAGSLIAAGLVTWLTSSTAAAGGLSVAITGVGVAMRGTLAAIGPAGWLILGLGAAATAWQLLGEKSSTAGVQMLAASDRATDSANKLVAGIVPALNTAIAAYDKMIKKQQETMKTAKTPVDEAAKGIKEADLNLQKLAQQAARAQQGTGEYVNMGPTERAAAEKAITKELEAASKKRGELAAKELEYNTNIVKQYVDGKDRQTEASQRLLDIETAKEKHDKALAAAGADRAKQDKVNAAYRIELANIEKAYSDKTKKGGTGVAAGETELAGIRARTEATQSSIKAMQEYGAAAEKQTEGEKLVFKLQQELAGGIKGVARANKEKSLAAAESLAAAQKEEKQLKDQIEAEKKHGDEYRKTVEGMVDGAAKTEQQAIALEAQNAAYGKSREAVEQNVLASKKLQLSRLEELGLTGAYTEALKLQIAAQERLVAAMGAAEYKKMEEHTDKLLSGAKEQASLYQDELQLTGMTALERAKVVAQRQVELKYAKEIDAVNKSNLTDDEKQAQRLKINEAKQIESSAAVNKVVQDDWAKTSEQINQSLADALMRGFEGGKDAAKNMGDTIVNMFKTMVLTPTLKAAFSPISGAISGAIGGGGGGSSASIGMPSSASMGWLTDFGGSASGLVSNIGAKIGGDIGAELMMGADSIGQAAGMIGDAVGYGTAIFSAAEGKWGQAAGAAIGQYLGGPIGSMIGSKIGAFVDQAFSGETRAGSRLETTAAGTRYAEGPSGGRINAALEDKITKSAYDGINNILKNLGSKEVLGKFVSGLETSDKGRGGVFAGGTLSSGAKFGDVQSAAAYKFNKDMKPEDVMKAYIGELNIATVEALKAATDLPKYAQRVLGGLDMKKLTPDEAIQALQVISEYPAKMLELAGTSRDALVSKFTEGMMDKTVGTQKAGQNVADMLVASIENAVYTKGMGQIFDIVNQGIITPVLDAMITGQALSDAISQAAIDDVIARANAAATALGALFNDAGFQAVLSGLRTTIGGALSGAAGQVNYQPKYQIASAKELDKASQDAAKAAEDARKKWQDITDNLLSDKAKLGIDLLRAQGNEEAALAAERAKAIEGYDAYQISLYDTNKALEKQIATQKSINSLTEESRTLGIKMLRAMGMEESALAEERAIATKGMGAAEVSAYDFNRALEKNISIQESLKSLRADGANLEVQWLREIGKEEQAVAKERAIATKGMSDLEKSQYDANTATTKLIDGVKNMKSAAEAARSALGVGKLPEAAKYTGGPGATAVEKAQGSIANIQKQIAGITDNYDVIIKALAASGIKKTATEIMAYADDQLAALVTEAEKAYGETNPELAKNWITGLQRVGELNGAMRAATENLTNAETDLANARTDASTEAAKAAAEAAKELSSFNRELASMRTGADIALARAMGNEEKALALERQDFIDGLYELTDAQKKAKTSAYDYVQSINLQIKAIENTKAAVDTALSAVQRAIDAEKTGVSKTAQAQIDAINKASEARSKSIDAAQKSVSDLASLFDDITSTVKTLRQNVVSEQMQLEQARAFISMSLSVARAGGSVNPASLRDAMQAVTKDTAEKTYASGAEFRFAQAKQANELEQLALLTGQQKDVAQQTLDAANLANTKAAEQIRAIEISRDEQLAALDKQYQAAQDQVSVMRGVDISVQSVTVAVQGLNSAIMAAMAVTSGAKDTGAVFQQAEVGFLPPKIASETFTLPSFDVGTNYVPSDMVAQIHEGEAIVPKAFNPAANGSTDNGELISEIRSLRAEVQRLQQIAQTGNIEQRRTANAVNGQPEAPMLVETV